MARTSTRLVGMDVLPPCTAAVRQPRRCRAQGARVRIRAQQTMRGNLLQEGGRRLDVAHAGLRCAVQFGTIPITDGPASKRSRAGRANTKRRARGPREPNRPSVLMGARRVPKFTRAKIGGSPAWAETGSL